MTLDEIKHSHNLAKQLIWDHIATWEKIDGYYKEAIRAFEAENMSLVRSRLRCIQFLMGSLTANCPAGKFIQDFKSSEEKNIEPRKFKKGDLVRLKSAPNRTGRVLEAEDEKDYVVVVADFKPPFILTRFETEWELISPASIYYIKSSPNIEVSKIYAHLVLRRKIRI